MLTLDRVFPPDQCTDIGDDDTLARLIALTRTAAHTHHNQPPRPGDGLVTDTWRTTT